MPRKKTTTANRKTTAKPRTRRKAVSRTRKSSGGFVNFFVPLFFIISILFCLGFLGFMGYRTVAASTFFDFKAVEVRGTNRVSNEEIEKIVRMEAENSGVWNADIERIKEEVQKIVYVKSATVSRVLPGGVRVHVVEREPKAVVRIDGGDFWADEDGIVLGAVEKNHERPPFVLEGWNRDRSEQAQKDNQERVRLYLKLMDEWQEYELDKRVKSVDMSNLQDPEAFVMVSGALVKISLGQDNFKERLQKGIKAVAGRGENVVVGFSGQNVIISPANNM